jgi:thioredoxin 1
MSIEILQRLGFTVLLILVGIIAYQLINRITLAHAASRKGSSLFPSGKPTLLYFTTPTCAPCKTIQRPAINLIRDSLGEKIQVVEIDAADQPQIASAWGVLSVPTTFIIDQQGKPCYVNHGITSSGKLKRQLEEMM